jgi:alpha-amylase
MFFSIVLHNHQPIGQLPWVLEEAWQNSYQPFLETLAEFPSVKIGLHFSGPLLDWLCKTKPQTILLLQTLSARGQIEWLCGGYYEPIFIVWPREDALAQIEKSRARLRELFGASTPGLWLTERIWQPQLTGWLEAANISYTLLDETLFQSAGFAKNQTHDVFQVGDSLLRVFPVNEKLRALLPWREPSEAIAYLKNVHHESGGRAHVVFADDGEKFGGWPNTFDWVYNQRWLRRFFTALENEADWLHLIAPWEYSRSQAQCRSASLPAGSYPEMQAWSDGDWRNFFERYPESREMRNEVLRVRAATRAGSAAREHILRAQCNDAYWHGVFGGLYLKHLRQAVYSECAAALTIAREEKTTAQNKNDKVELIKDGDDCIADNFLLRAGAKARGGQLFLLTSLRAKHNFLATLRRANEPLHDGSTPGAAPDWHGRGALLDHFFGIETTLEEFQQGRFSEKGDFIGEQWRLDAFRENETGAGVLAMRRTGGVWQGEVFAPLQIEKKIILAPHTQELRVEYSLHNPGEATLELWWGMEWNVVLSGVDLPERHYHADNHREKCALTKNASFDKVVNPIIADNWLGLWLEWEFPENVAMWHAPIDTVSVRENGALENIHQQSAFVFHRHLQLSPDQKKLFSLRAIVTTKP